jgi:hypothetical protein
MDFDFISRFGRSHKTSFAQGSQNDR